MELFRTVSSLRQKIADQTTVVGFVPTMGALHDGHIALVKRCRKECDTVIVSIFVNPTQFNDPKDLERYPRTENKDLELLEAAGVDAVFAPSVIEVYPQPDTRIFEFGTIDKVMEGRHRPGHFNGVAQVVSRLFEIVQPHKAYFGEKDFQQIAVIKAMTKQLGLNVQIIECPIVRASDGLALSSRNALLSPEQRASAPHIYQTLSQAAQMAQGQATPAQIIEWATNQINQNPHLNTEYIDIVDPLTLQSITSIQEEGHICAAVQCGAVRLIDNIAVNK